MKNIVLCGFMGSGKTTVGKLLGEQLHVPFVDVDDWIEEQAGMPIPEIFQRFSESGFRDREHQAVRELGKRDGVVLATGGGALTYERNIAPLKEKGIILYLNPGFEVCYGRIADSDRPLVQANTREQLLDLYQARHPRYLAACDVEFTMDGTAAERAEAIVRQFIKSE